MALTPPLHPGHINRPLKVVPVLRFSQPAALAFSLACLAAIRLSAKLLPDATAVVGLEIFVAVLALALSDMSPHWPRTSLRPMIGLKAKFKKEFEEKEELKKRKNINWGEEENVANPAFSTRRV